MAEVKLGRKIILFWRLLEKASETEGMMTLFQTEHSVEDSRDVSKSATKMGAVLTSSALEDGVPFKFLLANDDPTMDILDEAVKQGKKLELWEVDMNVKKEQGYPARYRQGYLEELTTSNTTEDAVEVEGTFSTELIPQDGYIQLDKEIEEAAQYLFRDLGVYTAEGGGEEETGA